MTTHLTKFNVLLYKLFHKYFHSNSIVFLTKVLSIFISAHEDFLYVSTICFDLYQSGSKMKSQGAHAPFIFSHGNDEYVLALFHVLSLESLDPATK